MELTRRSVLQAIASLGVAHSTIALARSGKKHRVIIVGAGASGLAAAYELDQAGHDVVVLEARSRTGGRMYTLREPFDDGLYAEAGALFLTSNNPGLDYARKFGLELIPIDFRQTLGKVAYVDGQRITAMPGSDWDWPVPLEEADKGLSIFALQSKYHRRVIGRMDGLTRLLTETYPTQAFRNLDGMSLIDFWRQNGASENAIELMRLTYYDGYGDGIETVSALQSARETASFTGVTGSFRVKGGNDRICAELATRLDGKVQLDTPVVAIRRDEDTVTLTVGGKNGQQEMSGDYAVLTAPIHVQDRIEFRPQLTPLRQRAIREISPTDVCRAYVQTGTRFWEREGLDGTAVTDLPIFSVYHSTAGQDGTRGILESFSYGPRARQMASLSEAERHSATVAGMSKAYPGIADEAERYTSYDWGGDPWARGGHAAFAPGQIGEFFPALQQPEGRLYFAGDAIGGVPGYSHAAFQSGIDVAAEIDAL